MRLHHHIKHHSRRNPILATVVVIGSVLMITLSIVNAATTGARAQSVFLELESGAKANVAQKDGGNASGGRYIQFINAPDATPGSKSGSGNGTNSGTESGSKPKSESNPDPDPSPGGINHGSQLNANNTGVQSGVTLASSGSIVTSSDGQVIENKEVSGCIKIEHSNVTVRNVRVLGSCSYGIYVHSSDDSTVKNLVIEHFDIFGVSGSSRSAALAPYGEWTAKRGHIKGYPDGVKIGNQTLTETWIEDDYYTPSGSHNDGVQNSGGSGATLLRNRIDGQYQAQTSAALFQSNFGPISDITFEDNYFSGGNYTIYLTDKGNGHGPPTNITVRNNWWERNSWQFGATNLDIGSGWTWENNKIVDNRNGDNPSALNL